MFLWQKHMTHRHTGTSQLLLHRAQIHVAIRSSKGMSTKFTHSCAPLSVRGTAKAAPSPLPSLPKAPCAAECTHASVLTAYGGETS